MAAITLAEAVLFSVLLSFGLTWWGLRGVFHVMAGVAKVRTPR